jgi:predicted metallopeptidase
MEFVLASDIKKRLTRIQNKLKLEHIDINRIICFRSTGSRSRAYARIWAFPRIWQMALNLPSYYCLEVLSEKFDRLNENDKTKVLLHELLHIPKNFSGALLPHRGRGKVVINHRSVEKLFKKLKS